jgi:hypothetical protein
VYVCIAEYFFVAILCARKKLLRKQGLARSDFELKIISSMMESRRKHWPFRANIRAITQQYQQLGIILGAEWKRLESQLG